MNKSFRTFGLILLLLTSFVFINSLARADGFNPDDYVIFLPTGINSYIPRPVIMGFSPSGRGQDIIDIWQDAAEEYNCIIIASNLVKNGMDIQKELVKIKSDLKNEFIQEYPIDLNRVIAVGSSGGGMASHLFSFLHPDTISAVITNVGYIHEGTLAKSKIYPRNKICAFLAGTTDYNYKLMKEDLKFLKEHGWTCKWIEFVGGHVMAPQERRKEALKFVLDELEKKEQEQ
ncbi:MAG: hypothetical protein J6Z11_12425 [Candidatus Riflebacteria bacterium]|nr:hypothetical protein [Candidatus Riflebacteria bacterium]